LPKCFSSVNFSGRLSKLCREKRCSLYSKIVQIATPSKKNNMQSMMSSSRLIEFTSWCFVQRDRANIPKLIGIITRWLVVMSDFTQLSQNGLSYRVMESLVSRYYGLSTSIMYSSFVSFASCGTIGFLISSFLSISSYFACCSGEKTESSS
jgi:hypothetical protein